MTHFLRKFERTGVAFPPKSFYAITNSFGNYSIDRLKTFQGLAKFFVDSSLQMAQICPVSEANEVSSVISSVVTIHGGRFINFAVISSLSTKAYDSLALELI